MSDFLAQFNEPARGKYRAALAERAQVIVDVRADRELGAVMFTLAPEVGVKPGGVVAVSLEEAKILAKTLEEAIAFLSE